ncbi:hypothetical protein AVEN_155632-1 [Araneus ventricosus]|uniref:Uncharacterized protein n=1 Tax=Araneus ventricosus TaxID=182803 RepID=A0A4Y2M5R2_ARAVE|nr:hypothetical protein AVEN_155632-1 [Araneus ventricosus]
MKEVSRYSKTSMRYVMRPLTAPPGEKFQSQHSYLKKGRGGLVVGYRLRGRRVPGSKPDFTKDPPCMRACQIICRAPNALPLVWCNTTHPAYPTGFKALKSRRGGEPISSRRRTQAPLAFNKNFSSHLHTIPRNMDGD